MKKKGLIFLLVVCAALVAGGIHAWSVRFMTDDAFISFRYAKNLARGLGLVYNAGERVEGFTNFLWTIMISAGMKLNFDPVSFSTALSMFFYEATLILYAIASWKLFAQSSVSAFILPLTTIALSVHHDINIYASGGLETAMFMFFVSAGFLAILLLNGASGLLTAGALSVLAMMSRPDGVVFLMASALFLLVTKRQPLRHCAWFLIPTAVIFVPYWMWRFSYYGYFFPNSFYAKSIDAAYYRQGIEYTFLFFKTYYVFGFIILLLAVYLNQVRQRLPQLSSASRLLERLRSLTTAQQGAVLGLLMSAAFIAFVIRIGGDFMFARFFIPVVPLLFFVIEDLLSLAEAASVKTFLACAVIAATFFRIDYFRDNPMLGYIADEARYYTEDNLKKAQEDGAMLHKYFEHRDVKVGFWAGQVKLIYYADPAVAIETTTGLTDAVIAHQQLAARGRPGHEKNAPFSYLIQRRVNFYIGPSKAPPEGSIPVNAIVFDKILAHVIVYEDSLMKQFSQYPEVKFVNVPKYLDSYIASMRSYPTEQVRSDFNFFDSFYFTPNNDTVRRNAFLAFMGQQ